MELSAELFSEIAGSRAAAPARHPTNDKRKHERVPLADRATVSTLSRGLEGMDEVVIVRDISVGGVGLLCSEAMEAGQEFVIQFSGQHGLAARILCKVARCEPGGFGGSQFIVGATFEIVIHPAQPSAGVANPAAAEENDSECKPCIDEKKPAEVVAASGWLRAAANRLQSAVTHSWRRGPGIDDDATRTA